MQSIAQIKTALRAMQGRELVEGAWNYVVEKEMARRVLEGKKTLRWLHAEYQEVLAASNPSAVVRRRLQLAESAVPKESDDARSWREALLNRYTQDAARMDSEVRAFRSDVFGEEWVPLKLHKVRAWIDDHEREDRKAYYRTLGILAKTEPPKTIKAQGDWNIAPLRALFFSSDGRELEIAPVLPGGMLDRLHRLDQHFQFEFAWPEGAGVTFALTDIVPTYTPTSTRVRMSEFSPSCRIEMLIDPTNTTPEELAAEYRRERAKVIPEGRRFRSISVRSLMIAFKVHMERREAEAKGKQEPTGAALMRAWNKWQPQEEYDDVDAFMRTARNTEQRLRCPPLAWVGGDDD